MKEDYKLFCWWNRWKETYCINCIVSDSIKRIRDTKGEAYDGTLSYCHRYIFASFNNRNTSLVPWHEFHKKIFSEKRNMKMKTSTLYGENMKFLPVALETFWDWSAELQVQIWDQLCHGLPMLLRFPEMKIYNRKIWLKYDRRKSGGMLEPKVIPDLSQRDPSVVPEWSQSH